MIFRPTRVGTLLLWLVLAVSVPLLLFTFGTVWRIQQVEIKQQKAALLGAARAAAQPVDRLFERLENGLLAISDSSAMAHDDLAGVTREIQRLSARMDDTPMLLAARDGAILLRTDSPRFGIETVPPVVASAGQHGPEVSGLLPSGHVAVVVPVPETAGQARRLILVALLDRGRLSGLLNADPAAPADLVITLRDPNGFIVARYPTEGWSVENPSAGTSTPDSANRATSVVSDDVSSAGQQAVQTLAAGSVGRFSVVATLPQSAFGASVRRGLIGIGLTGLAFLLIGLAAALYIARRLVGALHHVEKADDAGKTTGLREIDDLAARLRSVSAERQATETILRDSEAQMRDLVGTLDLAAIMAREVSGRITFWSQGCVAMYGWTRDEAIGQVSHTLLHTQFPVPLNQIEATLLSKGEWKGDLVHRRRDGTRIIVAAHKALKRDPENKPQMVMESLVDVTALRDAQDALRVLNLDLEKRVREEVAAREIAQQRAAHTDRIQALGQLAGGIAHDFNNVLQAIAGGAALIARRPDDTENVSRLVRIIGDAAARGASITRRMLVLVRRGDLKTETINPASLLSGMQEVFIHTLGAQISVEIDVPPGLPQLCADKAQLETALVNLGTNARDAMPDGGALRLVARLETVTEPHPAGLAPGAYIRLTVVDEGTGMSPVTLARVGEPFFTTKDVGKGTGLGLSMVKALAEQSGGGFAIESTVGVGTRASVWLPAAKGNAPAVAGQAAARPLPRLTGRILLVDDDDLVRDTLTDQLEALGHKVLTATGGTDALAILRAREAVDLMITDLSMPGIDGLTLIRKAHDLRPSMPAILLTGFAGDSASLDRGGTTRGTYSLLRKPATSAVLDASVAELLERA